MLEEIEPLTLETLNHATLAWLEREYNRSPHRELGMSPLERYLQGPDVGRESPDADTLRRAFRAQTTRSQRKSDGTCSLLGIRFEVPSRYRHLERLTLRYARWDLASVELIDPHTGEPVATLYPLDKTANADGVRRALTPVSQPPPTVTSSPEVAPLLKRLLAEYAATGLPPAYLPFDPEERTP
jgi:hypothetical protein